MDSACTTALRWPALEDAFYSILVQTDVAESFELSMYSIANSIADPVCLKATIDTNPTASPVPTETPTPTSEPTLSLPSSRSAMPSREFEDFTEAQPAPESNSNNNNNNTIATPTTASANEVTSETSLGLPLHGCYSWRTLLACSTVVILALV